MWKVVIKDENYLYGSRRISSYNVGKYDTKIEAIKHMNKLSEIEKDGYGIDPCMISRNGMLKICHNFAGETIYKIIYEKND